MYFCSDKYRLELHWDGIEYHDQETAKLKGALFSGPALKIAQKINPEDQIKMDLTPQHLVVLDSYYIVTLEWKGVEYTADGKARLIGAIIRNPELKTLHKLNGQDYIIIDTRKHEEKTHAFHLVYDSEVVRSDSTPYKYTK